MAKRTVRIELRPDGSYAVYDGSGRTQRNHRTGEMEVMPYFLPATAMEAIAYLPTSGKKYHISKGCKGVFVDPFVRQATVKEAMEKGYSRCQNCGR